MMFYINPGELRTKIRVQRKITAGTGSFKQEGWADLGNSAESDAPRYILCRWAPSNGSAVWAASSLQAIITATVTVRYHADITPQCRILRGDTVYEIIDISDPTQRGQWLLITVKAAVNT